MSQPPSFLFTEVNSKNASLDHQQTRPLDHGVNICVHFMMNSMVLRHRTKNSRPNYNMYDNNCVTRVGGNGGCHNKGEFSTSSTTTMDRPPTTTMANYRNHHIMASAGIASFVRTDGDSSGDPFLSFVPVRGGVRGGSRYLQNNSDNGGVSTESSSDRPFSILIMVCILICMVWTPMCIQRRCRKRRELEQQASLGQLRHRVLYGDGGVAGGNTNDPRLMIGYDDDAAAEFIRMSLRNFNNESGSTPSTRMATNPAVSGADFPSDLSYNFSLQSMTVDDRKDFIENLLICKQIVSVVNDEQDTSTETSADTNKEQVQCPSGEDESEDESENESENESETPNVDKPAVDCTTEKMIKVLVCEEIDVTQTSQEVISSSCAVCLSEYEEGDKLVWSQSDKCTHMFHKECMVEWLLNNQECPLCRHNYLSLDDDDDDDENDTAESAMERERYDLRRRAQYARSLPPRYGYNSSYRTPVSSYPNSLFLQHRNHSIAVPHVPASSLSSSSLYRGRNGGHMTDRDRAAYSRGVELIQLLQSLQLLSETQRDASIRLDGIELAYPNRRSTRSLHETRSNHSYPTRQDPIRQETTTSEDVSSEDETGSNDVGVDVSHQRPSDASPSSDEESLEAEEESTLSDPQQEPEPQPKQRLAEESTEDQSDM